MAYQLGDNRRGGWMKGEMVPKKTKPQPEFDFQAYDDANRDRELGDPIRVTEPSTAYAPHARKELPPLVQADVSPSRNSDPETAQVAALINTSLRKGHRVAVLEALYEIGESGATDYELSVKCNMLRTSAGKRRVELVNVHCAKITDERRETDTGTKAIVWAITGLGRKVIERIREQPFQVFAPHG